MFKLAYKMLGEVKILFLSVKYHVTLFRPQQQEANTSILFDLGLMTYQPL